MKFALVDGQRQEAKSKLVGLCPACSSPMVARCGKIRVQHWAHKGSDRCDQWWETESEWHRNWKNQFPNDWQEIIRHSDDGEKHIADVQTIRGWVIEFQHSTLNPDERRSREKFYQRLIWVVDGTKRKKDTAPFKKGYIGGQTPDPLSPNKSRIFFPKGALFRDWAESPGHVFLDFGDEHPLWWIFPGSNETYAYVQSISRIEFTKSLQEKNLSAPNGFDSLVIGFEKFIARCETDPELPRIRRLKDL